jgi:hypothetical protein
MALKIRNNIKKIQAIIKAEKEASENGRTSKLASEIQRKAVAAILGGAADWEPYMRIFATDIESGVLDEAALARLKPEPLDPEDKESFARNTARAYLIGNGNCGPDSMADPPDTQACGDTEFGVGDNLDFTLPQE